MLCSNISNVKGAKQFNRVHFHTNIRETNLTRSRSVLFRCWILFRFVFSILLITQCATLLIENICNHNIGDFNLMIESIASGLGFFSSELVADSGAGARILQGITLECNFFHSVTDNFVSTAQLQIMLQNFSVPTKVRAQLQQLLRNATDVGDRIVIHIKGKTQKERKFLSKCEINSMHRTRTALLF